MGKKGKAKSEEGASVESMESIEKEGQNLLGSPTFKELDNGRFKCLETGHELPAHARDSYAQTKHCRVGLIDRALSQNKSPLNMFNQDPQSSSKLICKLTGVSINKSEEHIWKHINGKRFLNMLDKLEAEKESGGGIEGGKSDNQKPEKEKEKKMRVNGQKKKKNKKEKNVSEAISEVRDPSDKLSCSDEEEGDFWMPPIGERWDSDDGHDRWGSSSEPEQENDEADCSDNNEQKKKRKIVESDVSRPSPSMRNHLDALASLKGEQVAARVTPEDADKEEWVIVKVTHFDRETREFEVLDEDPGDEEDGGGQRKYKLPMSDIIPFPKRNDPSSAQDFPPGKHVLALYPNTTALYKATVVQARKKKTDEYVLEFDDDEEDGSLPQRVVPFHRVVALPEGHRQ